MGIQVAPELDWCKAELQVSSIPTGTQRAASNLTAQQWAWEFLRRNPEYREAWKLMSSLSPAQTEQIGYLVDKRLRTLLHDSLIKFDVVCTLDLRFFDQSQLSDFEGFEGDGSLGAYRDHISKFDRYDPSSLPPVSDKFLLGRYCLKRWADPHQSLATNPAAAAALWAYEQHCAAGLEHAPWMESVVDLNQMNFRPVTKSGRSGKRKTKTIEAVAPLVKGENGSLFLRSTSIWGHDHKDPGLKVEEVDIRFDLTMPLPFQLKQAKAALKKQYELLHKAGILLELPKTADRNGIFLDYLHVLDRIHDGATAMDLTRETKILNETVAGSVMNKRTGHRVVSRVFRDPLDERADHGKITEAARQKILRALRLRDHGYKALAFL
jgi:Family of unknown function (DUF6499)